MTLFVLWLSGSTLFRKVDCVVFQEPAALPEDHFGDVGNVLLAHFGTPYQYQSTND